MEFDISKIYTAVNAESLPIGSKCIFAHRLSELKDAVRENKSPSILKEVLGENKEYRFDNGDILQYSLAYLIEPPKQYQGKYYKPFETRDEVLAVISVFNNIVKDKESKGFLTVNNVYTFNDKTFVFIADRSMSMADMFLHFTFADGSPFGKPVEE